jgi:hypothetical protein
MRKIFFISCFSAVISACFCLAAASHYSFLRDTAATSVEVINEKFINHEKLDEDQQRVLKRNLIRLRGGEAYLSDLHSRLWRLSVIGFGFLSFLSAIAAVLARRAEKLRKESKFKPA